MGLVAKVITIVTTVFHMFQKPEERWSMLNREMEDIKDSVQISRMKTTISLMKDTRRGNRAYITEKT